MKLFIKAVGFSLTPSLKTYIDQKLGVLKRFTGKFDAEGGVEMHVQVARTTAHHQKGLVFMAEADIRLPGAVLRATAKTADVRTAIDIVRDKLKVELEKHKTKVSPRGARKVIQ